MVPLKITLTPLSTVKTTKQIQKLAMHKLERHRSPDKIDSEAVSSKSYTFKNPNSKKKKKKKKNSASLKTAINIAISSGDSLIPGINHKRLPRKHPVKRSPFHGASVDDTHHYLEHILHYFLIPLSNENNLIY